MYLCPACYYHALVKIYNKETSLIRIGGQKGSAHVVPLEVNYGKLLITDPEKNHQEESSILGLKRNRHIASPIEISAPQLGQEKLIMWHSRFSQ